MQAALRHRLPGPRGAALGELRRPPAQQARARPPVQARLQAQQTRAAVAPQTPVVAAPVPGCAQQLPRGEQSITAAARASRGARASSRAATGRRGRRYSRPGSNAASAASVRKTARESSNSPREKSTQRPRARRAPTFCAAASNIAAPPPRPPLARTMRRWNAGPTEMTRMSGVGRSPRGGARRRSRSLTVSTSPARCAHQPPRGGRGARGAGRGARGGDRPK